MDYPACGENAISSDRIPEPFFLHQVDWSTKEQGEFIPHGDEIPKAPRRLFLK